MSIRKPLRETSILLGVIFIFLGFFYYLLIQTDEPFFLFWYLFVSVGVLLVVLGLMTRVKAVQKTPLDLKLKDIKKTGWLRRIRGYFGSLSVLFGFIAWTLIIISSFLPWAGPGFNASADIVSYVWFYLVNVYNNGQVVRLLFNSVLPILFVMFSSILPEV
jgi:hypothetical protein